MDFKGSVQAQCWFKLAFGHRAMQLLPPAALAGGNMSISGPNHRTWIGGLGGIDPKGCLRVVLGTPGPQMRA